MKRMFVFLTAMLLIAVLAMPVFAGGRNQQSADGLMTIEMFNVASNYTGIQPGWFGQMLREKFNIQLNIIAPQVSGAALFQTRSAAGYLGDIVLLDNSQFTDSINAGLIMDISGVIRNYPNLMAWEQQIMTYNRSIPNAGSRVYGIPAEMTNTSPTAFTATLAGISPWLPWDLYVQAGAPRLRNTNDLLDVLEIIQRNNPRGVDGNPAYAISLWPDWDGNSCEIINQTVRWYGVQVNGSVLMDTRGGMKPLTDDNGEYLKLLRFFFDANQRGLVDPDSGVQQWDQMVTKMENRRVYLWWYNWQRGFWNSTERGNAGVNFMPIPVDDMYIFQEGDSYYGIGRVFGLGANMDNAKRDRILQVLDWLASPEGLMAAHNGIEGFNYVTLPDGTYRLTPEGEVAWATNPPVPAEWGGGGWRDGNNWININIASPVSTNPRNGIPYDSQFWPAEIEKALHTTQREWSARFGAANQVEYLIRNNQLGVIPQVNVVLPVDPTDIALIRSQCGTIVVDTSWRMMLARTEAEFNSLWAQMKTQLNGFGWERLVQYDMQRLRAVVDARNAAMR